uniref:Bromo domain-containing protein n=1 Tax=Manihot esculenta TaxID=3983 RepID=A0A2C9W727_MANES
MGQIVKRKKKGRPSKADLAQRSSGQNAVNTEHHRWRSLRRRNVRYNNFIDYDDYVDEFEEYEESEEEEKRKEKKLKLVLKLNSQEQSRNKATRVEHARGDAASSSEDDESEKKPLRKRKIDSGDDSEAENESENDHGIEDDNNEEERERKVDTKRQDSVPGTPTDHPNGLPLPDKKSLELILDKLQKKDTYGVYAEPVDVEELPDYFDVIAHPMDFATVRKKLAEESYWNFEQFESDVFLICSNAMQYNSPETIYHKQARAIQELARKKFEKLRIDLERSEKELKSELKTKPNFLVKKQMKKPLSRTVQEPVGSDFSSGATLATAGDYQSGFVAAQSSGCDRPSNIDGPIEGTSSLVDNTLEKAEELPSGKGLLSKYGRKSSMLDENRRATYNISSQPAARSESIFTTFEGEIKQLVAVGLHADYSYARSLACFAAMLGPVAWKVACQRIEQALPPGCKFGRGWVGEYEPLPTPVLMVKTHAQKEYTSFTKLRGAADAIKSESTSRTPVSDKENHVNTLILEGKPSLIRPTCGHIAEGRSSSFSSSRSKPSIPLPVNPTYQQQNLPPRKYAEAQNKASKQVELNLPPSSYQNDADVAEKHLPGTSETANTKPREIPRTLGLMQSVPSKQPDDNEVGSGGLPNGKVTSSLISRSSDGVPNQMARAPTFLAQHQEHFLHDPVEAMRISAERAQKQQKPSNQSSVDTSPVIPSLPPVRKDSNNAAAVAARAWMSIGSGGFKVPSENFPTPTNQISAESLYNQTWQLHPQFPQVHGQFPLPLGSKFHTEKNSMPFQAFMQPPVHAGNGQFQNRLMVFPQFVATSLSGIQMQSSRQGLSPHSQPKQKQEALPPDLNICFQSQGSPVKQSSGVMVESQQPDLALQL